MYGIYANIGGILMGSMLPYIAYMDPMGMCTVVGPNQINQHKTLASGSDVPKNTP